VPIVISRRFARDYANLPPQIQRKVDQALTLLDTDFRHPSLRAKPIQGTPGLYEARVDQKYRMTYERDGDRLVLRKVGDHDPTLKNP
jgi:mRNA-degrading endonuclease RelE of RelBE toxin-antitoxin system